MLSEADIIINGKKLTEEQSCKIRCLLTEYRFNLVHDVLNHDILVKLNDFETKEAKLLDEIIRMIVSNDIS